VGPLRGADRLEPALQAIVGDVVHNLRTALDFIAAEIVKNEPECIREISYFPLGGTKNDLISSSRYRFIQRAAPDLASVIADIVKPYKAGGDWRFNAINELDRMEPMSVSSRSNVGFPRPTTLRNFGD
jgi:hypothetical protein